MLRLFADIRERRLGDALEHSSFVATVESGTLDLRDANTRAALRIAVDKGEVRADAGAPVTASLDGTAGGVPIALKAQAGRLRELFEPAARLPFSLTAETPGARLAISGTAAPQRDPAVALSLALSGERLDGLDSLLEASLPPWGPYALTGRLRFSQAGLRSRRDAARRSPRRVLEGKALARHHPHPAALRRLACRRAHPARRLSAGGLVAVRRAGPSVRPDYRGDRPPSRRRRRPTGPRHLQPRAPRTGRGNLRRGGEAGRLGQGRARPRPAARRPSRTGARPSRRSRSTAGPDRREARSSTSRASATWSSQRGSTSIASTTACSCGPSVPERSRRRAQPGFPARRDGAAAVRRPGDRFRTLRLRGLAGRA